MNNINVRPWFKGNLLLLIMLMVSLAALGACDRQQVRVAMVEPSVQKEFGHFLDIRNCQDDFELVQSLASEVSVQEKVMLADEAISNKTGEPRSIPPHIKEMLESEIKLTYQDAYAEAQTYLEQTELRVPVGKIRMYNLNQEVQVFNSIVTFDYEDELFEMAFTYELTIPRVSGFMEISCTG